MDSIVGFHLQKKDGKLFLAIHQPELHPIPQTKSSTSFVEAAHHDQRPQSFFLCPTARWQKDCPHDPDPDTANFSLTSSYEYVPTTTRTQQDKPLVEYEHPALPLFWCNNKEDDFSCNVCSDSPSGTGGYYFCESHGTQYHKECVESPLKIKHPYHYEHPLQLWFDILLHECLYCGGVTYRLQYCCSICNIFMHPVCAMQLIPFLIDKPKRHEHPLSFFTRLTSLLCNVCGLSRNFCPTYICVECNFVAHKDCMSSPSIIKISRHNHRISYISSLRPKEWSCGVCRQSIDYNYGAYTCEKCSDYVVHSRCALQEDVCDGEELDGVPEEDYIIQDVEPFDAISEGEILHFLHDHHLVLEVNMLYDENKFCQACILRIYEGNFYSCKKCDFILHESCANAPRMIQHALHPHQLALKDINTPELCYFLCYACGRYCDGFAYQCSIKGCYFLLDVRCASIFEPFDYKDHEHALFLAWNSVKSHMCQVCKRTCIRPLNCINCDFIVCFKCASSPDKVRYKHDEHFLTILWGKEVCGKDCCEQCECDLEDTHEAFYSCKECCTFLHAECLFGRELYRKPHPKKYRYEGGSNSSQK